MKTWYENFGMKAVCAHSLKKSIFGHGNKKDKAILHVAFTCALLVFRAKGVRPLVILTLCPARVIDLRSPQNTKTQP